MQHFDANTRGPAAFMSTGRRMLIVGFVGMLAGCQTMSGPGPDPNANPDPNGQLNQPDPGNGGNPPPPPPPPPPPAIPNSANSISSTAGGPRNDPEGIAPPAASTTLLSWKDSRGGNRTMTLGAYLYQYEFSYHDNLQVVSRSVNDDAYGHAGFGYVVSHNNQNGNSPLGKVNAPTAIQSTVLAGGHHAIYRIEFLYDRDKEGGGNGIKIPVVIEWMVATGRDHPVWAVNWKTGNAINPGNVSFDAYRMDVRGPYGSLNFDGAANKNVGDAIGGVAWGDAGFKFTTTDAQLTMMSPWTYNTANSACFTRAWTANVNAEMGIVQTITGDKQMGYGDRVVGRERGKTSADVFTNKGDCNGFGDPRVYSMPCINGWPYQLMNYDWFNGGGKPLNEATGTKLIAWGSPYGWLGASSFDLFDYSGTANGTGDRSYATFIVLGPRNYYNPVNGQYDLDSEVERTVRQSEALAGATLTGFNLGMAATQAPRGPGSAQLKNLVNGYNDTYAAYFIESIANGTTFTYTPAPALTVVKPIFVLRNYAAETLPFVSVNGVQRSVNTGDANSGAFVSLNTATDELWVTLNEPISAASQIVIMAP